MNIHEFFYKLSEFDVEIGYCTMWFFQTMKNKIAVKIQDYLDNTWYLREFTYTSSRDIARAMVDDLSKYDPFEDKLPDIIKFDMKGVPDIRTLISICDDVEDEKISCINWLEDTFKIETEI